MKNFVDLVEPYQPMLMRTCYAILQNYADAEEIAQETLLKAFSRISQLRDGVCFKSWLLQIAVNEARMLLRKKRSLREEAMDANDEFMPRNFTDWRKIPSEALEHKQLVAAISTALLSLDPIYREVIVLRDVQGLSIADTANTLGITEAAVTSRLHRARLQMREKLAPQFRSEKLRWLPVSSMMIDMARQSFNRTVSCKRVMGKLSEYIDGTVDAHLRKEIERHLSCCHRCRVILDSVRKLIYLVGDDRAIALKIDPTQQLRRFVQGLCYGERGAGPLKNPTE